MTRSLYKGLQCSKSRVEVEQSYIEENYKVDVDNITREEGLLDLIDNWHNSDSNLSLHTSLGLTWEEFLSKFSAKTETDTHIDELTETMFENAIHYEDVRDTFIEVNPSHKDNYQASDYTVTWGGVDITSGWWLVGDVTGADLDRLAQIPVRGNKPNLCVFNDCGWCYYNGDESNDKNGQCNNSESCEVNGE